MYKVVLADDEVWMTLSLKKLIEKSELPFQIAGEAMNGLVALEMVEEKRPDVLITDIRMPGYDGLELIEQLKKRNLDTKVILISGYAEFEYARKAIGLGASEYLLKPVKAGQLYKALENIACGFQESGRTETEEETELTWIQEILKDIKENYTKEISLTSLAQTYNISVSYLSERLKEQLGMSFSEYLISKRIQKAKELLKNERLSVQQVGEQSGYKDYYYFIKVFKKATGISPSKYRKQL